MHGVDSIAEYGSGQRWRFLFRSSMYAWRDLLRCQYYQDPWHTLVQLWSAQQGQSRTLQDNCLDKMVLAVRAPASFLHALRSGDRGDHGLVIGCVDGSELIALGAVPCLPADFDANKGELMFLSFKRGWRCQEARTACTNIAPASRAGSVEALLPPPLGVVGTFVASAPTSQSFSWQRLVLESSSGKAHVAAAGGSFQAVEPVAEVVDAADLLAARFIPVRLVADHVLEVSSSIGQVAAFAALEELLCGSGSLYLAELPVSSSGGGNCGGNSDLAVLQQQQQAPMQLPGAQSFEELGGSWRLPTTLRPFVRGSSSGGGLRAPVATLTPAAKGETLSRSLVHLDVLVYAPKCQPAEVTVAQLARPAAARQLASMRAEAAATGAPPPLSAFHFAPPALGGLHLTLIYPLARQPTEAAEAALAGRRAQLHELLGLPSNRPMLRVACAVDLGAAALSAAAAAGSDKGGRLSDVHVGLPPSGVGGSVHLVRGSYQYFHYMQVRPGVLWRTWSACLRG